MKRYNIKTYRRNGASGNVMFKHRINLGGVWLEFTGPGNNLTRDFRFTTAERPCAGSGWTQVKKCRDGISGQSPEFWEPQGKFKRLEKVLK